ncbi:MAG TPA: phytanoyl-CoA dioxygenase family protein, partial [Steroidobacteraceae bacterium]
RRCRDIASMLLGTPVGYQFDHAIFKPPMNQTATAWHQDEAYSHEAIPLRSVHFWIPLQPVTIENGCMWFVPGSNQNGLLPHHVASRRFSGPLSETTSVTLATKIVDESKAVACPLPLGGATVHHPLTLPLNRSQPDQCLAQGLDPALRRLRLVPEAPASQSGRRQTRRRRP